MQACFRPGFRGSRSRPGATAGWHAYVGAADDPGGAVLGLDRYGESAPAGVLFKHFGFTADAVATVARRLAAAGA